MVKDRVRTENRPKPAATRAHTSTARNRGASVRTHTLAYGRERKNRNYFTNVTSLRLIVTFTFLSITNA